VRGRSRNSGETDLGEDEAKPNRSPHQDLYKHSISSHKGGEVAAKKQATVPNQKARARPIGSLFETLADRAGTITKPGEALFPEQLSQRVRERSLEGGLGGPDFS